MTAQIRGLTLRHPWPQMFLLDDGPKRLENRDWTPPKAMVGQLLALHGGALPKSGERKYLDEIQAALRWVGEVFEDPDAGVGFSDEELLNFCTPGIFGVARLVDVVTTSDDPWFVGDFGWVLADFVPIDPPVADRSPSHQGLWQIEPNTLITLRERYKAAYKAAQTPAPQPITEPASDILARVARRQPLNEGDRAQVIALIQQDLMHVTPEFDRKDVCPYRLTVAGQTAVRTGQVGP
ncbi:hypothetical protein [Deinococcus marmoris]|uniref:hypothetical protein n=1 Tax=Deinococcus marmoris TaxID=249408 RepID=UPI0004977890|nr:hypothetical protein [Deinococcus marmoris]